MKKYKLGLNKLALSKSKVAELSRESAKGGWNTASTNPFCFATGYYDDTCDVTALCNTSNHCGASNAYPLATANCNSNQTLQFITCIEPC